MKTEPTRLNDIAVGRRDIAMLEPADIKIDKGHNPRDYTLAENRAHLDELKASIKDVGVLAPLLVRWSVETKQVILVDGECRLRACLELLKEGVEIASVPTMQVKATNEGDRLIMALTANTGKPLSKWEVGSAFRRLLGYGWDADRIVARLGYKKAYVQQAIELSDAPEEVKHMLSEQAVTPSLAVQVLREHGEGAGAVLRGKAEAAKAKAKPGKKAVAKRESAKAEYVRVPEKTMKAIRKALEDASTAKDETTAELAQKALNMLDKRPTK